MPDTPDILDNNQKKIYRIMCKQHGKDVVDRLYLSQIKEMKIGKCISSPGCGVMKLPDVRMNIRSNAATSVTRIDINGNKHKA